MNLKLKKAGLSFCTIQVSSAHSDVLHYIANVFQLIHRCYCVTALEKEAEAALLTKMCPGSIISVLRDIKHNITMSGYTLCSYSAQKTTMKQGPKSNTKR